MAAGVTNVAVLQTMEEQSRSRLQKGAAGYCRFSNPNTNRAHSEDDVLGQMLQLHDRNRFESRAVGRTARVMARAAR